VVIFFLGCAFNVSTVIASVTAAEKALDKVTQTAQNIAREIEAIQAVFAVIYI